MTTNAPRADAAAASVGARDLFVLRRVTGNRFVHDVVVVFGAEHDELGGATDDALASAATLAADAVESVTRPSILRTSSRSSRQCVPPSP